MRWYLTYFGALLLWICTTALHIPDGYLSPLTSLIMFLLVLPFWAAGLRKIGASRNSRNVPLVAVMAAFCFVIMMFNVPLPGGTSGHAAGAALAGIILGPETAAVAVSIALIIQALFFGDGGILAIGANCFNIAVVVPFVAAAIYRSVAKDTPLTSRRRPLGAAVGGWLGLTIAALLTGVEFGIQPLLFHSADGAPLYAPYSLGVAIPAMVIPHALAASVVEGLLSALVIAYLQRSNLQVLEAAEDTDIARRAAGPARLRWLWTALAVLIVASPLGLLAPGTAWGEWGTAELSRLGLQSIPAGLDKLSGIWGAPLADYVVPGLGSTSLGYVLSAMLGVVVVGVLTWLFLTLLTRNGPIAPRDLPPQ